MPSRCRWCSRPSIRTVSVEGPDGATRRVDLCERHLGALQRARSSAPDAERHQRRMAEAAAWRRVFGEPAPFEPLAD
ncbi:MAG TPA: hypothetical protein VFR97_01135 [Capillimicrobium sp.]|nr:hypothetical protein [Capillimicrobium sp.]